MRVALVALVALVGLWVPAARAADSGDGGLAPHFDPRLAPGLAQRLSSLVTGLGGRAGVVVGDREGHVEWALHPDRRSPLASNTKLFVTGLAAHRSGHVGAQLARILRPSDNVLAQRLFEAEGGAAPVTRFARSLHAEVHLVDGSGLSRADAATPRAVASYLSGMAGDPHFREWRDALPLAGVSGTLADRMVHSAAHGRCRAKTGTLSGVSALSGYCTTVAGHAIVFSILMDGVDVGRARAVQDSLVELLVAHG